MDEVRRVQYSPESLQAFAEAACLGSFSAAARKLGKSQSTVSEAIARLEIDLGLDLFDRSARQPRLTEAGKALLGRVEEVLMATDRLGQLAGQLAGGIEPRVTLAMSDTYQSEQFEKLLDAIDQHFPDIEFEWLIAEHGDVLDLVGQGRAVLGLLAAQPNYPPDIGSATLGECAEFGLFVSREHPLARLERVERADLLAWRKLRLNTFIDDAEPSLGGRCWSAPTYLLLLDMAVLGFGWVELPSWMNQRFANGRLHQLQVPGWPRSVAVDVVWSRQRSLGPAARWLVERLLAS
ncbi:DNA-binding transcriptional regulator, LysR family [Pseudomonas panipatensis]|uniref:DNA-binding transcriptional regulator, LysR family n=1 Tax=Pseudomonas panipatensis TaxID=428992 RepID=A0A1G8CMV8_9PSED|nr:DNA-binding transcriptional regulator, LysR family [Pseudomonas panipatensis]SMP64377.1 DNA-binding transcriptional regulator, LysR family [Pseudomonas panipatensis]